jgi:hypothetical protein
MLRVAFFIVMTSVVLLNVVILGVVAPHMIAQLKLLAQPTNVRLGKNCLPVTNTLAFYIKT